MKYEIPVKEMPPNNDLTAIKENTAETASELKKINHELSSEISRAKKAEKGNTILSVVLSIVSAIVGAVLGTVFTNMFG